MPQGEIAQANPPASKGGRQVWFKKKIAAFFPSGCGSKRLVWNPQTEVKVNVYIEFVLCDSKIPMGDF